MPPRLRVLIFGEDAVSCSEMFGCLQEHGCRLVGFAADQRRAAALARDEKPDVILAGGRSNKSGGIAGLRALKRELGLPLVLVGDHWAPGFSGELKQAGVDSLVPANSDPGALAAALHLARRNQMGILDMARQTEKLSDALQTRKLVGRAAGLLMDHKGLERKQSLAFLDRLALKQGLALEDAAIRIIAEYDESLPEADCRKNRP